jgi:uncharacterized glyoxalase superfamily protein PhnB
MLPALTVKDADASLEFYRKAFGFEKRYSMPGPDGRTMHADIAWRDSIFMIGPEHDSAPCKSPATSGIRPPSSIYVYCDDVDALFKQAVEAGATVETPPQNMFWGDRMCSLIDLDGYIWCFATNVAPFDPKNIPC